MGRVLSEKNTIDHEQALLCIVATPTLEQASDLLAEQYGMMVSPQKLAVHKRLYADECEKLRDRITPQLEKQLSNGLLDNATIANEATNLAIQRTRELLEENRIPDPAKAARDLADVQAKSIDKKLSLEGRPSRIVDNRSAVEIMRALEGMKVIQAIDASSEDE